MEKLLKNLSICTSEEKRTCSICAYGNCGKSTMTCRELLEECKIAVEKQIPKKPIFKFIDGCGNKFYSCPECGSYVMSAMVLIKSKYCMDCGQAIDWSE